MYSVQAFALFRNRFWEKNGVHGCLLLFYIIYLLLLLLLMKFLFTFFQKTFVILAFSKHYVEAVLSFVGWVTPVFSSLAPLMLVKGEQISERNCSVWFFQKGSSNNHFRYLFLLVISLFFLDVGVVVACGYHVGPPVSSPEWFHMLCSCTLLSQCLYPPSCGCLFAVRVTWQNYWVLTSCDWL